MLPLGSLLGGKGAIWRQILASFLLCRRRDADPKRTRPPCNPHLVPTMMRSILSFLTLAAVSLQASAYGTFMDQDDDEMKVED
jgi:hypothetical protein